MSANAEVVRGEFGYVRRVVGPILGWARLVPPNPLIPAALQRHQVFIRVGPAFKVEEKIGTYDQAGGVIFCHDSFKMIPST
jgi:hypothetical protein